MHARMTTVAKVVAVVHVIDINIVGLIPVGSPGFWPRINNREPEAAVLEAGASIDDQHGRAVDAEIVSAAKVFMESLCGNAIARVASAIMPRAVVTSPILRTLTRPDIVGWRMRHSVVVVRHVLVGGTIVRLVDVWPVLNRAVLGRARNLVLGPRRRAVIRMLLRSLVVVIAGVVALMLLRTAVVVVVMPMLCIGGSARSENKS